MEHNIIDLESDNELKSTVLYQMGNNLDKRDNLDELPSSPAVYAICGRVNGQPANARYVDVTSDLKNAIKSHFSSSNPDADPDFKEFMSSIKTKELVFKTFDKYVEDELEELKSIWVEKFKPDCTNELLKKIH